MSNNPSKNASNLTPMERWQAETSRDGPYDNVSRVAMGSEVGVTRNVRVDGTDTDAGTWWPR